MTCPQAIAVLESTFAAPVCFDQAINLMASAPRADRATLKKTWRNY